MMTSAVAQDLARSEIKQPKENPAFTKRIKSFHNGRSAYLFPGVTLDVNEGEFVELMLDLDQIYDTSHRLHVVLLKYTSSIDKLSKTNSLLGL
jgi:hypothetical protein